MTLELGSRPLLKSVVKSSFALFLDKFGSSYIYLAG